MNQPSGSGPLTESLLRGQLGSLEAERDRYRRENEILTAETEGLKRAVAALSAEKIRLTDQVDRLSVELQQERSEKKPFEMKRVLGAGKEAVVEMEAANG